MAKKSEGRTFNVSVIGLSGTEREKGQTGVGKSCLCNRFLYQVADKYHVEHISVLSQSDFAGRVINNDHFLYWGDVTKTDDGNNFTFQVVEQTEFIDDVSFQPFKTGRTEPYIKRCVATKVQSAEKLMYICKDQLGMETDYEQKLMPEGKLAIDGFICCFDASPVPQRPADKQVEFLTAVLNNAIKTKKPVVLATTKQDEADAVFLEKVEKLLNKREFKGNFPLVETSAHDNVNVELAFMTLAHMIDKTRVRVKSVSFQEALKARNEILRVATTAYLNLLKLHITDPKAVWAVWKKKFNNEPDFGHYVDLFGTDKAKSRFRAHTKKLRDEQIHQKEINYLSQIPKVLKHFLPDLDAIADRSWPTIQRNIQKHEDFHKYFVEACPSGQGTWKMSDSFLDSTEESRIPFDLLNSSDSETCFRNHVNELQADYRKKELQQQFKKLLEDNRNVMPGKPLSETYVFFVGKECYNGLNEIDRVQVYEQHQQDLKQQARQEFQELLWEQSLVFFNLNSRGRMTPDDLKGITNALQADPRYRILHRLEEDRKVMILNHLGFIQCPSKDRCYFRDQCVDTQVQKVLAMRSIRPELTEPSGSSESAERALNLVLLGKEGLAIELNRDIRNLCSEDEYQHENIVYSLDYRPIDGDVSLEHNALATANFKPHGCLCVYNSMHTLEYVRSSLERSLFSDLEQDEQALNGMPIAVIQAYSSSQSEKEREILHEEGQHLAKRLQGEFIDIPEEEDGRERRHFHLDQIHRALQAVIHRCSTNLGGWLLSDQAEPDIRISMCIMCGDQFPLEVPLGPLLNHEFSRVSPKHPNILTQDTFLEFGKQRIEVEVTSYHGGTNIPFRINHGYILVYSTKRKASLYTLRAFALRLPPVPKLILAVADSGGAATFFSSEFSQSLITEGNSLADMLGGHFMTSTANFQQQTAVYIPFFKEVWERKEESEDMFREPFEEPSPPAYEDRGSYMDRRPPAPLPNLRSYEIGHTTKSSTSNSQSTEDSEPVYDQPNLFPGNYPSDSDHDRPSSASPPPSDELYAEIDEPETNGEHLVRPSYVKTRRTLYAAWALNEPIHQTTAAAFPSATKQTSSSEEGGWVDNSVYESSGVTKDEVQWSNNERFAGKEALHRQRFGSTQSQNEVVFTDEHYSSAPERRKVMGLRTQSQGAGNYSAHHKHKMSGGRVQAPLAVPEPIEIADYCMVKDAVSRYESQENDYASVQDALPAGKLCRIKSTNRQKEKGTTDSEDSEFSSLEREKKDSIYTRVSRRPTPYRKKSKQKSQDSYMYDRPVYPNSQQRQLGPQRGTTERVRSNSPSDGSEGTGDELQGGRREKKRRSFRTRKWRSPATSGSPGRAISPPISDSDHIGSPPGHMFDEDNTYNALMYRTVPTYGLGATEDVDFDPNDSGHWRNLLKVKTLRDPEKQRKKEEKRRQKEEEKKQKEQQKLQKKIKKKDSKSSGPSQSGCCLEDFPTSNNNPNIPVLIEKCVTYIEEEGLRAEGIYRIPGNKQQVDLLITKFNEDSNLDIHTLEIQVNAVATILKGFFMELTEPLIPVTLYEELIHAAGVPDKSSRLLALRGVLKKLPEQSYEQNFEVLKYLITHLHRVTQEHEHNSMDSQNLARCWWPTVMRLEITSYEQMGEYARYAVDIMQTLIEQYSFFFHGGNEV